jgi:cell division protein FtsX
VEGIALGIAGSLAAMGLVFVVYLGLARALEPLLSRLLTGYTLVPFGAYLQYLLPGFLCVGLLTGGGGSMVSITRYLKEKVYEKSELET